MSITLTGSLSLMQIIYTFKLWELIVNIWFNVKSSFSFLFSGSGSTDYGKGMQIYTLMKIWFTRLVQVTTQKIGSSLKLQGLIHPTCFSSSD
jgi:hypothetical protein